LSRRRDDGRSRPPRSAQGEGPGDAAHATGRSPADLNGRFRAVLLAASGVRAL
jgi:hypothetical protein